MKDNRMSVFSDIYKDMVETLYEGMKKLIENTDRLMENETNQPSKE